MKNIKIFIFLLLSVLSMAVSRGPIQPEYATFESVNNTDMVNLSTGDFVYTMPLVNIPGPGGGFAFPLSYHAGIELEEESSWVGLGWSLNAGAITRTINQNPDDFCGEHVSHVAEAPGGHGYSIDWGVYSKFYDSQTGSGGRAGLGSVLSVGFGNQNGFTVIGVTTTSKGVSASVESVVLGVLEAAAYAMIPADGGASAVALNVASGVVSTVAGAMIGNAVTGKDWKGMITNQNRITKKWRSGAFNMKKNYSYYYYSTRTDRQYGALYLGQVEVDSRAVSPVGTYKSELTPSISASNSSVSSTDAKMFSDGAVSDVSVNADDEYMWSQPRPHIAFDVYNVGADGVGGKIAPYRTDIGSVAFNQSESNQNAGKNNISYYIKPWLNTNSLSTYKTQFKYTSELSNNYFYHNGSQNIFKPSLNADVSTAYTTLKTWSHPTLSLVRKKINYDFIDDTYTDPSKFYEANRTDQTFLDGKLATGKYIQYFTNEELKQTSSSVDPTVISVYQDHMSPTDRASWRNGLPAKGIGGFVITNSNGLSYHFTIPVYKNGEHYFNGTSSSSRYEYFANFPVAVTWLLTAVTGADYIDRGEIGMVDEEDWGYWVTLEYGKFTSDYRFASPYNDADKNKDLNSDSKTITYRTKQENYYLDKISTSTHTALFIKDRKKDGKSYFSTYNEKSDIFIESLRLDEIVILENKDYEDYLDVYSSNNKLPKNIGSYTNGDFREVLDQSDIQYGEKTYLEDRQQKRIVFNYDYSLCQNTPNSFEYNYPPTTSSQLGTGGKLTLNSISIYGKSNVKLQPDFEFDYDSNSSSSNPDYSEFKHDGWGQYSSTGEDYNNAHLATDDGSAWSLRKITTPIGSEIEIEYERDDYYSLSGANENRLFHHFVPDIAASTVNSSTNVLRVEFKTNLNISNFFSVDDYVNNNINIHRLNGGNSYDIYAISGYTLTSVGADYFEANIGDAGGSNYWGNISTIDPILVEQDEKIGGGIRVKSIKVIDELDNEIESRYIYTQDGSEPSSTSPTSGVCTMEPKYIHMEKNLTNYPQYKMYDFPGPFIIYNKVTVYNNYKSSSDYLSKEEYTFVPPNIGMVRESHHWESPSTANWEEWYDSSSTTGGTVVPRKYYARTNNYNTVVNTGEIGQLHSIKSYGQKNMNYKSVSFSYDSPENEINFDNVGIGYYTEGCFLTERLYNSGTNATYYRNFKALKTYTPFKMVSSTVTENGTSKTIKNTDWDFITGAVLETEYENSLGDRYKTQDVPAYTKYPEMGHILWNTSQTNNKHMLSQSAGSYLYTEDKANPGVWNILSANAIQWSNDWDYRSNDNGEWVWEGPVTDDAWRPKQSFSWKTTINPDGTYKSNTSTSEDFVAFNWASPQSNSSNWVSSNEVVYYDHYSVLLANKSSRDIYTVQKTNNSNLHIVLKASNARYSEVVFSGAEDHVKKYSNVDYFNHEVFKGSTSEIVEGDAKVHTGKYSLELESGEYGFNYHLSDLQNNYDINRKYKVSVWVKNAIDPNVIPSAARIFVQYLNGGTSGSILHTSGIDLNSGNVVKAGDWYRFMVDLPVHDGSSINLSSADYMKLRVMNSGSSGDKIYVDDFRFYPESSRIVTSVYQDGLMVASHDANNLSQKVTYDNAGRAIKSEIEVLDYLAPNGDGGFKIKTENKFNYGRDLQ